MKNKDNSKYWFDNEGKTLLMESVNNKRTRFHNLVKESSYSWYAQYIPDACNMDYCESCAVCPCKTIHGGCYEKEILILDNGDIKFDGICYNEDNQNKLIDAILTY